MLSVTQGGGGANLPPPIGGLPKRFSALGGLAEISILALPEGSLPSAGVQVVPQPTPKTAHGTSPKNTRVRNVHVVRSDLGRIRQAGHAEAAPPGWTARAMGSTPCEWCGIAP